MALRDFELMTDATHPHPPPLSQWERGEGVREKELRKVS